MEKNTHSGQFLSKRKFFLLLPLLVLPFATLLFWALGGGKREGVQAGQSAAKSGLNTQVPDAYLKDDKSLNKLSYYEKATLDSQKMGEQIKNDPYYMKNRGTGNDGLHENNDTGFFSKKYGSHGLNSNAGLTTSPINNSAYSDPNEAKVYERLIELNKAMNEATIQSNRKRDYSAIRPGNQTSVNGADIDRLEQMITMTKNGENGEDPEMKQLNGLMDKILDIQHPDRVKERTAQTVHTNKSQVFAVTVIGNRDHTSLLANSRLSVTDTLRNNDLSTNGFFSLEDDLDNTQEQANTIRAVVHENQTVVDGAIVKLRLQTDISVNGTLIPKGGFVYGAASLNGERLIIKITGLRYQSSLFPVQLSAYDLDGMEGVYVPGSISRDVAKNSAERAIQSLGMATLDPSLNAQAASAGIEAVKTLLSRKAKLIKVTLKAGYQVLLKDDKQKNSF